ncbi:hypothetical protein ACQ3HE_06880 [Plantibacter auratus]|uniref:hypothetical protein n=1 Tax=Plantibacter auratus TaxID=272914 RepID=UPI003D32D12C
MSIEELSKPVSQFGTARYLAGVTGSDSDMSEGDRLYTQIVDELYQRASDRAFPS